MNWLKNFVPPKLRKLVGGQREIPENLWHKCPNCSQMIFHRDLAEKIHVCPHCDYHFRISSKERMQMLLNDSEHEEIEINASLVDPLKFRDLKKYPDRLKEARTKTGKNDVLTVTFGQMETHKVVLVVFDFAFMGGSMGIAVGDGILEAGRKAIEENCPLIIIPSSGGARMQEGVLSLMQLSSTTIAINEVKKAGLPYIVVLTDPTTGGVSASFAMLGDIAIAEPGCRIGFAGKRVIEQTIRENLPEGFQKAEYLLEHGMIDMVVHRHNLRETLVNIINLLTKPKGANLIKVNSPIKNKQLSEANLNSASKRTPLKSDKTV